MAVKRKIKWIAILVLTLCTVFIVFHLSTTKFSSSNLVPRFDYTIPPGARVAGSKKLWGQVKSLESLQPYSNPRSHFPVPSEENNGYIYAKIFGGFERIRSSICDLVTISRLLNATLIIPEIQESLRSNGISYKFKSFSYLYDEEQFIAALKNDVIIVNNLPNDLMAARKRNKVPTFKPSKSTSSDFYVTKVLPTLKRSKVVGLILSDGGCLESILPPSMYELQRLRCRVAFTALQFRPEIQLLGRQIVERLRFPGQPFLAFHPGLVRDTLAYHGCGELFQDVHTELIQYRRAQMIKQKILNDELSVDSHVRRDNGSCPLMPEEVGILLRAMGYPARTTIYIVGSETFGGQRVLIPLRSMFPNSYDRTSMCSKRELSDLVGPERPLPPDSFEMPPFKSEKQLREEWDKAGPRPRPLPPPPDRPIYRYEKEGWYGWINEMGTEPEPSPMDLRMKAHRLLWDALDYIVSVEADAFFPGFNNDGSAWPDFSSLVMGHRLYERAASRTYRPDRKVVAELFNTTRDNIYQLKNNWTLLVREHLNRSLREDGLIRQSRLSKPVSFLSHPLPECACRLASSESSNQLKGNDGRFLYGGEDECPHWMQQGQEMGPLLFEEADEVSDDGDSEYENDMADLQESDYRVAKTNIPLAIDQDDQWDPSD